MTDTAIPRPNPAPPTVLSLLDSIIRQAEELRAQGADNLAPAWSDLVGINDEMTDAIVWVKQCAGVPA